MLAPCPASIMLGLRDAAKLESSPVAEGDFGSCRKVTLRGPCNLG